MRTLLIALTAVAGCVVPSPDQTDEWVAFSSGRSGEGDVYAIGTTPGTARLLIGTAAPEGTVRYDPALHRLVHSRFDSLGAMLMSGESELFRDPNGDVAPVWSATGSIAFVVEAGGRADVFVANSQGGERQKVTADDPIERYPAWDVDGQRLVYAKRLSSGWDLHVLEVETRSESRVTFDGTYVGHPAWSPDGRLIAFDRMYEDQTEIAVLDLVTGEITRLTENAENDLVPAWSMDGAKIAFAGVRDANWDVWIVTVDDGTIERVTTDPGFDGGPIFLPASAIN